MIQLEILPLFQLPQLISIKAEVQRGLHVVTATSHCRRDILQKRMNELVQQPLPLFADSIHLVFDDCSQVPSIFFPFSSSLLFSESTWGCSCVFAGARSSCGPFFSRCCAHFSTRESSRQPQAHQSTSFFKSYQKNKNKKTNMKVTTSGKTKRKSNSGKARLASDFPLTTF